MGIFPCKKQKQIIHDYPVSAFSFVIEREQL